jgi:hypothetical protein
MLISALNLAFFSKTTVMIQFLAKTSSILRKKAIFSQFFGGEIILKIRRSVTESKT